MLCAFLKQPEERKYVSQHSPAYSSRLCECPDVIYQVPEVILGAISLGRHVAFAVDVEELSVGPVLRHEWLGVITPVTLLPVGITQVLQSTPGAPAMVLIKRTIYQYGAATSHEH